MDNKYDYNFVCTYNYLNDDDERDLCYKLQFMQAFNMSSEDEFNNVKIEDIIDNLYLELKDDSSFMMLLKKLRDKMDKRLNFVGFLNGTQETTLKDSDVFCFAFSFDYFYKFHREYCLYKKNLEYNFDFIM